MSQSLIDSLPTPYLQVRTGWPWTEASESLSEKMPDGSDWPRISIVTPSFNQGEFLEETIRSVLLQCYPNLEYIIIDGGSTDNSVEIINRYEPWLTYWVSEPDNGQSHAINKGLRYATGELQSWLNSDDYYLPGALNCVSQKYLLQKTPSIIIGYGDVIDKSGSFLRARCIDDINREKILEWSENWFLQQACFWPRSCWESVGGVDEDLHLLMDYDLWLRFSDQYVFESIHQKLGCLRYYTEAKTVRYRIHSLAESIYVHIKNGERERAMSQMVNLTNEKEQAVASYGKCEKARYGKRAINFVKRLAKING